MNVETIEKNISRTIYLNTSDTVICVLELVNGFTVADAVVGSKDDEYVKEMCKKKAMDKVYNYLMFLKHNNESKNKIEV